MQLIEFTLDGFREILDFRTRLQLRPAAGRGNRSQPLYIVDDGVGQGAGQLDILLGANRFEIFHSNIMIERHHRDRGRDVACQRHKRKTTEPAAYQSILPTSYALTRSNAIP